MFYHLLRIRKRTFKDVAYEVYGKEEAVGNTFTALAFGGHYGEDAASAPAVSAKNTLRWWKIPNPFKLVEFVFALMYWGLDEISQLGLKDSDDPLTWRNTPRVLGRLLVYATFGLVAGLVKYVTSPYNQIAKPIKRMWDEGNRKEAALFGAVAFAILVVAIFCVISVFTAGVPVIPVLVAGLTYAAEALAGWLGGTFAVTIVAQVLVSIGALVFSQAIVQKIFNLPNILRDFWYGITGQGGYDAKKAYVAKVLKDDHAFSVLNLANRHSAIVESTALQYDLFNAPFQAKKAVSMPAPSTSTMHSAPPSALVHQDGTHQPTDLSRKPGQPEDPAHEDVNAANTGAQGKRGQHVNTSSASSPSSSLFPSSSSSSSSSSATSFTFESSTASTSSPKMPPPPPPSHGELPQTAANTTGAHGAPIPTPPSNPSNTASPFAGPPPSSTGTNAITPSQPFRKQPPPPPPLPAGYVPHANRSGATAGGAPLGPNDPSSSLLDNGHAAPSSSSRGVSPGPVAGMPHNAEFPHPPSFSSNPPNGPITYNTGHIPPAGRLGGPPSRPTRQTNASAPHSRTPANLDDTTGARDEKTTRRLVPGLGEGLGGGGFPPLGGVNMIGGGPSVSTNNTRHPKREQQPQTGNEPSANPHRYVPNVPGPSALRPTSRNENSTGGPASTASASGTRGLRKGRSGSLTSIDTTTPGTFQRPQLRARGVPTPTPTGTGAETQAPTLPFSSKPSENLLRRRSVPQVLTSVAPSVPGGNPNVPGSVASPLVTPELIASPASDQTTIPTVDASIPAATAASSDSSAAIASASPLVAVSNASTPNPEPLVPHSVPASSTSELNKSTAPSSSPEAHLSAPLPIAAVPASSSPLPAVASSGDSTTSSSSSSLFSTGFSLSVPSLGGPSLGGPSLGDSSLRKIDLNVPDLSAAPSSSASNLFSTTASSSNSGPVIPSSSSSDTSSAFVFDLMSGQSATSTPPLPSSEPPSPTKQTVGTNTADEDSAFDFIANSTPLTSAPIPSISGSEPHAQVEVKRAAGDAGNGAPLATKEPDVLTQSLADFLAGTTATSSSSTSPAAVSVAPSTSTTIPSGKDGNGASSEPPVTPSRIPRLVVSSSSALSSSQSSGTTAASSAATVPGKNGKSGSSIQPTIPAIGTRFSPPGSTASSSSSSSLPSNQSGGTAATDPKGGRVWFPNTRKKLGALFSRNSKSGPEQPEQDEADSSNEAASASQPSGLSSTSGSTSTTYAAITVTTSAASGITVATAVDSSGGNLTTEIPGSLPPVTTPASIIALRAQLRAQRENASSSAALSSSSSAAPISETMSTGDSGPQRPPSPGNTSPGGTTTV